MEERLIRERDLIAWFRTDLDKGTGYGSVFLKIFGNDDFEKIKRVFFDQLTNRKVSWPRVVAFISGRKS
jgi:hypothetical protein